MGVVRVEGVIIAASKSLAGLCKSICTLRVVNRFECRLERCNGIECAKPLARLGARRFA
jgi:hypothetical protein